MAKQELEPRSTTGEATTEGRRMSREADIMFMIDAVGEQNGKSDLREEGMGELRCYGKEMTTR